MARFARLDVLDTILDIGLVPLFYHADPATAMSVVSACVRGNAKVVELTNRGEKALEVFTALERHFEEAEPTLILGVGSVVDAPTAAMYLASGANFVVGPTLNPEIARLCNRRKVAYIPGCATATELSQAEELGVEICKVFPAAQLGGPSFIKAQLAPCPWRRLMPTGGLDATEENVKGWIKGGAAALGLSSKLITRQSVAARDFEGIAQKVAQAIRWIREARGKPLFQGVEHVGLYPHGQTTGEEMVAWYERTFDFQRAEGATSYFLSTGGQGRIEVDKAMSDKPCHVAIRVTNFEQAVAVLEARGVALRDPIMKERVKAVYLEEPDPAGNLVHLLWTL